MAVLDSIEGAGDGAHVTPRRTSSRKPGKTRTAAARRKSASRAGRAVGARVKVVRSRSTRARRPARPLPSPDPINERLFTSSLERSLRDYRVLWEALAKR